MRKGRSNAKSARDAPARRSPSRADPVRWTRGVHAAVGGPGIREGRFQDRCAMKAPGVDDPGGDSIGTWTGR